MEDEILKLIRDVIDRQIDTKEAEHLRESLTNYIKETVSYDLPIKIVVGDRE
tara:strand:- start:501 stop:656 length:156 start_codon:yes stop_codon:yes gene_type:complete